MPDRRMVIDYLKWAIAEAELTGHTSITLEPLKDALALLKEQEPRVMTLEEARETMQTADLMYCEDKNDDTMAGGLVLGMRTDVFWDLANGEYMDFDDLGYFGKLAGEYGKSFRFWTSRPTPEQMRETKWEGADNG